jgi:putative tryptophan/tyrosine transport system substrate-binding protein
MKRREFIAGLGSAAAGWPLAARAQQSGVPVIGFIHAASPKAYAPNAAKFAQGLGEAGFFDGRNVVIEYRWAESNVDVLPTLAADLVRRRVAVIVAGGGSHAAAAAKSATSTTPIVLVVGDDPVKAGLAASLSRPEGTVTGVTFFTADLMSKRVDLLRQLVPRATRIAFLEESNLSRLFQRDESSARSQRDGSDTLASRQDRSQVHRLRQGQPRQAQHGVWRHRDFDPYGR